MIYIFCSIFFFKQKTAYDMRISDWSSDVCSSDLGAAHPHLGARGRSSRPRRRRRRLMSDAAQSRSPKPARTQLRVGRLVKAHGLKISEERRVGKERGGKCIYRCLYYY